MEQRNRTEGKEESKVNMVPSWPDNWQVSKWTQIWLGDAPRQMRSIIGRKRGYISSYIFSPTLDSWLPTVSGARSWSWFSSYKVYSRHQRLSVFVPGWGDRRRKPAFLNQCSLPMHGLTHTPAPPSRTNFIIVFGPLRSLRKSRGFFFFLVFHGNICWPKHGLLCSTHEPAMAMVEKSHDVSTHVCIWMWTCWQITACHSQMSELRWKCQFEQMPFLHFLYNLGRWHEYHKVHA